MSGSDNFMKLVVYGAIVLIGVGITVGMYASDDSEIGALESQGLTDVHVGGWAPMACSDSDTTSKHFTAKNANGQRVKGVVCCGVFKGCTVRW